MTELNEKNISNKVITELRKLPAFDHLNRPDAKVVEAIIQDESINEEYILSYSHKKADIVRGISIKLKIIFRIIPKGSYLIQLMISVVLLIFAYHGARAREDWIKASSALIFIVWMAIFLKLYFDLFRYWAKASKTIENFRNLNCSVHNFVINFIHHNEIKNTSESAIVSFLTREYVCMKIRELEMKSLRINLPALISSLGVSFILFYIMGYDFFILALKLVYDALSLEGAIVSDLNAKLILWFIAYTLFLAIIKDSSLKILHSWIEEMNTSLTILKVKAGRL